MSSHLSWDKALELLDRLQSILQSCASRADQLERESSLNASRLDWQIDKQIQELEKRLSTSILELATAAQARTVQFESSRDRRKVGVLRAHTSAKKRHLKLIESREGRQINEVQRELLQTSRNRDAEQESAHQSFAQFQEALAREQQTFTVLERRTRNAFRGYAPFRRLLEAHVEPAGDVNEERASTDSTANQFRMLEDIGAALVQTKRRVARFRMSPLPFLFSLLPPWLLILLLIAAHAVAVPVLQHFGLKTFSWQQVGVSLVACVGGVFVLHILGRLMAGPPARALAAAVGQTRALLDDFGKTAEACHHQTSERIRHQAEIRTEDLHQRWYRAVDEAEEMRQTRMRQLDVKLSRASAKNDQLCRQNVERLNRDHDRQVELLKNEADIEARRLEAYRAEKKRQFDESQQCHWRTVETEWENTTRAVYAAFAATRESAARLFPEWDAAIWVNWTAPREFAAAAPFARLDVDVERLAGGLPRDRRLALPGPARFALPLLLTCSDRGSILFETKNAGRDLAIGALNNLVLRLLSVAPPGRVLFTLLDPLDLGQSFAGLMHLTDFEDRLINRRVWTQPEHIEQRLAELNEHIEKVTQLYLRNEYATIADYNKQAGRIAEPCHFLVVADFPVNFSDLAVRRLLSIIASGGRCGVFTLIHWDQRKTTTSELDDLRKTGVRVCSEGDRFVLDGKPLEGTSLFLESPPDPQVATAFLEKVGRSSVDSNRVEMPFVEVAPKESDLWTIDTSAELRVPIGRTGATKFQHLALGKGTRQHVLIAGKTGSGKSTLFHVIITNLALWCSPEQVEFYLVDFKKGVEFKCYATGRLPHARVVAIESDREFGLSVLERVDDELRRRGDLFRRLGVQDLAGYTRAGGTEPLPRTLLIIDEFQEFFVEDDRISQHASLLLDRLVRQGRAFGIHVLLGSQTLGGAYSLARTTLGQMVVRIALQCNEADSYLIMDDDNPAPRLLSRPGEAIYNDSSGALEGNSPFQVVWLADDERFEWLEKIRLQATRAARPPAGPVVFEGNSPADVRENALLSACLEASSIRPALEARAWLGAPNSIKGPTEVAFHRQSGQNLLIVGQRDESALAMLGIALVSLASQSRRGAARFIVLDVTPPGSRPREVLEQIVGAIVHPVTLAGHAELNGIFAQLADEFEKRTDSEHAATAPALYLFVHGIQRFKGLRHEDEFSIALDDSSLSASPGKQLNRIICEGTHLGFHAICTCDTLNNANRFFSRKTLSEFGQRVLFQMSANDSASLIDTPKAAHLGFHRALFQNAQTSILETFRPYALPDSAWIEEAARNLARLLA